MYTDASGPLNGCSSRLPGTRATLAGEERLAAAPALFTRLRLIGGDGRPLLAVVDHPDAAPSGCQPWYSDTRLQREGYDLVFGHWALLGVTCLDGGCVYGGRLCALEPASGTVVTIQAHSCERQRVQFPSPAQHPRIPTPLPELTPNR
jgi:hypothetical protein